MTQESLLEEYLSQQGRASKQEILRATGIWNSGEVIRRLRVKHGYDKIRTDMEKSGVKRYAVYVWMGKAQTELSL